jgi:aminoglycoside phosphotransferase (APT) family kinase protein
MTMANSSTAVRPGDKPVRNLPPDVDRRLSRWFELKLGTAVQLTEFRRPSDGFSGDTFFVRLNTGPDKREQRFVIRSQVKQNIMIPMTDFSLLHRVQQALNTVAVVPVPAVLFVEESERTLGAPFYVSEFIDGLPPGDSPPYTHTGWVSSSSPEQLRTMVFSGIEALGKLHNVEWESCGLGFLAQTPDRNRAGLEADCDYFVRCCDWGYGGRWSLVDEAVAWLRAHWPETERLRLSWGDARLGNMLWRDHRPTAVLDWDWAAIADPERDLGYWLFNHRFFQEILQGLPLGWPTRAETIRHYEQCSGYAVRNMAFYEVYGCFRQVALMIRVAGLMRDAGTMPTPDFVENNPCVNALRDSIAVK